MGKQTDPMFGPTKVFQIVQDSDLVIVTPQGAARDFPYREVHMESNVLLRVVTESKAANVLFDLKRLDFIDSVMVECVLRVLTVARQRSGIAGFCNVSDSVREVLSTVRLGDVWHDFETREAAIASIRESPDYS